MTVQLPPFPVDDATLGLLEAALDPHGHGDPDAKSTSVWDVLRLYSELGGSDTTAVAEVHDDGSDGGARIVTMRDPHYHDNDVLASMIAEVRRLRSQWARLPEVLAEHSLFQIVCDPIAKTDNPICACSRVHLGWHPSIGAATRAWVAHVMEIAEQGPGASQHKEDG
ncbi:MAG: hypothetical protein ACM30G_15055 [Micromonosporaceae bacterium]